MFCGIAAVSIVATAVSAIGREAAAKGLPITDEQMRGIEALAAKARDIMADERTAYEDAGMLRVYPKGDGK
jgi:hypothetical protein